MGDGPPFHKTKHKFVVTDRITKDAVCTRCGLRRMVNPRATDKRKPYYYWWESVVGLFSDSAGYCGN